MSALLARLTVAAEQRGLLAAVADTSPARVFALVRDMPYRRASSRRPESIIDEWPGTCSGKHYLLHALFNELDVDATWPRATGRPGFAINEEFVAGRSMRLACTPIEIVEIPAGVEPQAVKEALIARHCAGHVERRERFIEALGAWLAET